MMCAFCHEKIEVGEAQRAEPIQGTSYYRYYHIGCHLKWLEKKLHIQASYARIVH